jgi:hypothetical protein
MELGIVCELIYEDNSLAIFWNDHLFSDIFTSYFLKFTRQFIKEEAFSENDTVNAKKKLLYFLQNIKRVDFFLCTAFNTASSAAPSDSIVSEDAGR